MDEQNSNNKTVAVLGASPKPERYSNKAVRLLSEHGYRVVPVHPAYEQVEDLPVVHSLDDIKDDVFTLSLYLSPQMSRPLVPAIIRLKPRRVVFNPGTEDDTVEAEIKAAGIPVIRACTLVLLKTGQFESAFGRP